MSSCTERNPIRQRTETDWTANGNRSDGGRKPIGRRTESDWTANANDRGCSCLSCTNQANWQSIAAVSAAPTKQTGNLLQLSPLHQQSQQNNLFQLSPLHQPSKQAIYCSCLSSALPLARARTAPTKPPILM